MLRKAKVLAAVILVIIALALMVGLGAANTLFNLEEYKTTAKAEVESYVIVSDYSAENWAVVLGLIEDGKAAIDAATDKAGVDSSVTEAKTQIDTVEKGKEMADFVLTISVENTTVRQGEEFKVIISLKNQSGKDCEIAILGNPFRPEIPNWEYSVDSAELPEFPALIFIENNGIMQGTKLFGSDLEIGKHELTYRALFFTNWVDHDNELNEKVTIWSNTIIIVVQ